MPENELKQYIRYLEKKTNKLNSELINIHNTRIYRVVFYFQTFFRQPLKKLIMLPKDIFQLILSVGRKKQTIGWKIINDKNYIISGKQVHRCNLFQPIDIFKERCHSGVCIYALISQKLLNGLSFDIKIIDLSINNANQILKKNNIQYILIESAYFLQNNEKLEKKYHYNNLEEIKKLKEICKQSSKSLVFWHTNDKSSVSDLLPIAKMCDFIYAADTESMNLYNGLLNSNTCNLLPVAIQPAIHNKVVKYHKNIGNYDFKILFDGWFDFIKNPIVIESMLCSLKHKGLHIIESQVELMANKLDDLPKWEKNILGCVSYYELLSFYKAYKVIIITDETLQSNVSQARKIMEAISCGISVVYFGNDSNLPLPQEFLAQQFSMAYKHESNLEQLHHFIEELILNETKRKIDIHLAIRCLYERETYSHRLRSINKDLGLNEPFEMYPLVSVITPTFRYEMLKNCYDTFKSFTYPNKEWVIVLNQSDIDADAVRKAFQNDNSVSVFQIHEESNIGVCLNYAILNAKGEYWFKMDDDDIYAPEYLKDMILNQKSTDSDVFGKPAGYIYFEAKNNIYKRIGVNACDTIATESSPHLCGATLAGKTDVAYNLPFAEDLRASVDSKFYEDSINSGYKVHIMDCYNFIAVRQADKKQHTWRKTDQAIMKNSSFISDGNKTENIFV